MEKIKQFENLLRHWFMDNETDINLLNFVLNYALKEDFKKIEEDLRQKYGV